LENIAIIKEVHEHLATKEAQKLADEYLQKINISKIGLFRPVDCSQLELFYVAFIRALMSKEKDIMIITPFSIINNLGDIAIIIEKINILNDKKNIFILDTNINKIHYKEDLCPIIE